MDFKTIDKSNYRECMELQVEESQKYFVADNTRSLVEAAYEDGLYTLGVYDGDTMVGFVLYDYDDTYPGWSMSRFMIGRQFQGNGHGKRAVREFLDYFKLSIVFFRSGVFGAVPARTVARKHSKYKAFLYIGL